MTRKTANDFDPKVSSSSISCAWRRRPPRLLDRVAKARPRRRRRRRLAQGAAAAFRRGRTVKKDDSAHRWQDARGSLAQWQRNGERLSRPAGQGRRANCRSCSSCTRIAASIRILRILRAAWRSHNFVVFAPDALAPLGGYPGDEDKARELFHKLDQAKTRNDFIAAYGALKPCPIGNGKVGVVGFCYGGGIVNFLATKLARSRRWRSLLWRAAAGRGGHEDQGAAAHPLCRRRRSHQRRLAGL